MNLNVNDPEVKIPTLRMSREGKQILCDDVNCPTMDQGYLHMVPLRVKQVKYKVGNTNTEQQRIQVICLVLNADDWTIAQFFIAPLNQERWGDLAVGLINAEQDLFSAEIKLSTALNKVSGMTFPQWGFEYVGPMEGYEERASLDICIAEIVDTAQETMWRRESKQESIFRQQLLAQSKREQAQLVERSWIR